MSRKPNLAPSVFVVLVAFILNPFYPKAIGTTVTPWLIIPSNLFFCLEGPVSGRGSGPPSERYIFCIQDVNLSFDGIINQGVSVVHWFLTMLFFGLEGPWGQPEGPHFPFSPSNHVGFTPRLLTTPQKVLSLGRQVELKMLDFSDRTRTGISILTSDADLLFPFITVTKTTRKSSNSKNFNCRWKWGQENLPECFRW